MKCKLIASWRLFAIECLTGGNMKNLMLGL